MRLRAWLMALALVAAASTNLPHARASIVEALDLATLVAEADDVVLARVIKEWSHYDERNRIVTDYTMQVEETHKGTSTPGSAIIVRRLGGVVGDRGLRIAGEPTFQSGELVLLFGSRDGQTYVRPVGMAQGAMRVFERAGERMVKSDTQGMALVRRGKSSEKSRAVAAEPRKLDELLREVDEMVGPRK